MFQGDKCVNTEVFGDANELASARGVYKWNADVRDQLVQTLLLARSLKHTHNLESEMISTDYSTFTFLSLSAY